MKNKLSISIESKYTAKLDEWAEYKRMTRSSAIEYMIEKLDMAEANLGQFAKSLIYDPNSHYAVKMSKDYVDMILAMGGYTDAQHFANVLVLRLSQNAYNTANSEKKEVVNSSVIHPTKNIKMNEAMAGFLGKVEKTNKMRIENSEMDADGNIIPEY